MTESRTLVSFQTVVTDDQFRSDHLKLCFLWYDEVLFDYIGTFDEARFFDKLLGDVPVRDRREITDVVIPLARRLDSAVIGNVLVRLPSGYPRWGNDYANYDYPEPADAFEFAHNALLRRIESDQGVTRFVNGYDIQQAEGRARGAVDTRLSVGACQYSSPMHVAG